MQQDTIEATIDETDVILMMFIEGVHGVLQWGQILGAYSRGRLSVYACPQSCGTDF
jgi:hypothetical protein